MKTIRVHPDPVLRRRADPIVEIDDKVRRLAIEMLEAMYANAGVGLAAPQVGESVRLVVIDVGERRDGSQAIALVNPEIVETRGNRTEEEGCLSVPSFRAKVPRADRVKVKASNLEGKEFTIEGGGLLAQALQHEIDHLEGVLFIDLISPVARLAFDRRTKGQRVQAAT